MALKIKNVKHKPARDGRTNTWCGPAAVSAILGITAEVAAKRIKAFRVRNPFATRKGFSNRKNSAHGIGWAYTSEVLAVIQSSGYPGTINHNDKLVRWKREHGTRQTLAQWDANRAPADRLKLFLVVLSDHFIVVQGDKLVDNHYNNGTTLSECKTWKRTRLTDVYEIRK